MSNFLDALSNAARSSACSLLGNATYINDALQRAGAFPFDAARRAIPDFWRNALCDTPAPPPRDADFSGGQCDGLYSITFRRVFEQTGTGTRVDQTLDATQPLTGPISQQRRRDGDFELLVAIGGGGAELVLSSINVTTNTIEVHSIVSVTPVGGFPDSCGDPAPTYPELEEEDVTRSTDVTYQNNLGVEVTIPVVFVFARASFSADANITIPFTANINGELDVTGNLNLDGTVNFNFGSAGGGPAPKDPRKSPCDDIALPVGTPTEDPTDAEQPPQPDRDRETVIKGVLVTVTSLANERASTITQDDNPDIYVPSLGHVNFLCRVGQTSAGWTTDIQVKNRRHLIQCPWDWGAIEVRGTPQPGVTWELTPIAGYVGQPVEYVQ